jgi:hypothetical protein
VSTYEKLLTGVEDVLYRWRDFDCAASTAWIHIRSIVLDVEAK